MVYHSPKKKERKKKKKNSRSLSWWDKIKQSHESQAGVSNSHKTHETKMLVTENKHR